jgi:hypothetical protein
VANREGSTCIVEAMEPESGLMLIVEERRCVSVWFSWRLCCLGINRLVGPVLLVLWISYQGK